MFLQPCIDSSLSVSTEASAAVLESSPEQEEGSVQFSKLSYLGCTWVKAPRNETEAQKAIATLRAESAIPIPVTLHVPNGPDGCVRSVTYSKTTVGSTSLRPVVLYFSVYIYIDVSLQIIIKGAIECIHTIFVIVLWYLHWMYVT